MKTLFNAIAVVVTAGVEGNKRMTEVLVRNSAVFADLAREAKQSFIESALPAAMAAAEANTEEFKVSMRNSLKAAKQQSRSQAAPVQPKSSKSDNNSRWMTAEEAAAQQ